MASPIQSTRQVPALRTGDELPLPLCVLAARLKRGEAAVGLGGRWVADLFGDRGYLLGALSEDVALQLLDGGLDGRELFDRLRLPRAPGRGSSPPDACSLGDLS
jgi:hypothetical protein